MKIYVIVLVIYYVLVITNRSLFTHTSEALKISFLDVGQGDAAYIKFANFTALIDAGPPTSMDQYIFKYMFPNCDLDIVYITHPHLDHFGGLEEILKFCSPELITFNDIDVSSRAYVALTEKISNKYKNKKFIQPIFAGNKINRGALKIIVLWPTKDFLSSFKSSDDLNTVSTVLFVDYKDFEALFTGDAEALVLSQIDYSPILPLIDRQLDILKVPHHGSAKGLTPGFLAMFKPKYCVISVGASNKYKHPTDTALSFITESGCISMRTDTLGTIEFKVD